MCTYNGARFLKEQLESISQQTRLPDELVICDDCSTDKTPAMLRSFAAAASFPVRLYFNDRNLGSLRNFEQAIGYAEGELISLCDQDDIWHRDKIERTKALFQSRPQLGLVFSDGDVVDENAQPLGMTLWQSIGFDPERQTMVRSSEAAKLLSVKAVATGTTMTFRAGFRHWLLPIPSDTSLIHDGWIALMISLLAPIEMISEPLISYRIHSAQQIGTPLERSKETRSRSLRAAARSQVVLDPEIRKLEVALERLGANNQYLPAKERMDLTGRLQHLKTRVTIRGNRLTNVPDVLRELLSLRYHRYSNGVFSALKDLLC
jgi:hypothetical protein